MALPTLAADPGVAVKTNAKNATADAAAILPIVFNSLHGARSIPTHQSFDRLVSARQT
jgi:hypothetical protein